MKTRKLMALALAALLAATNMSLTALADEPIPTNGEAVVVDDGSTVAYEGDITTDGDDGLSVSNGSTVTYEGDIDAIGYMGIIAVDSSVTSTGNVTVVLDDNPTGVYGTSAAEINHTGDVEVDGPNSYGAGAYGGSTVTVTGDVTAYGDGAWGVGSSDQGSTVTVNGDVTAEGNYDMCAVYGAHAEDQGETTVNGNVTVEGTEASGAHAVGGGTTTVNGDISATGLDAMGAVAEDGGTVTVTGDVTVSGDCATGILTSGDDSTITVTGNIVAEGEETTAIFDDHGSVTVDGDVTVSGNYVDGIVTGGDDSVVTVTGDVVATEGDDTTGIRALGGSVTVDGDVTATGNAIIVGEEAEVVVGGAVSSDNVALALSDETSSNSVIVAENGISGENAAITIDTQDEEAYVLPTIVTTSITTGENGTLISGVSEATAAKLIKAVNYIVKAGDGLTIQSGASQLSAAGTNYNVAKAGSTLVVKPTVTSGYKLNNSTFGIYAGSVTQNGDGTYSILVGNTGSLSFELKLDKLEAQQPEAKAVTQPASGSGSCCVGDSVRLAHGLWILTSVDSETGLWTLMSGKSFTDAEMQDMAAQPAKMLTVNELRYVQADADTQSITVTRISEKDAKQYVNGDMNHICIVVDPRILKAE